MKDIYIWKVIKKVYPFIKSDMIKNIISIVLSQFATVVLLLIPLEIKFLLDDVLINKSYHGLLLFSIMISCTFLVATLSAFISNYIYANFAEKIVIDSRSHLYKKILNSEMSFFVNNKSGDIITRLRDDSAELHTLVSFILNNILTNSITLIVIFIILFKMNFKLAIITILMIPIFLLINQFFSKKVKKESHVTRQRFSDLMSFFMNTLSKIVLIKNFNFENQEAQKHKILSEGLKKSIIKAETYGYILTSIVSLVTNFNSVIILILASYIVINDKLTIGSLIAYYSYLKMIYDPMLNLSQNTAQINRALAAVERYFEYYDLSNIEEKDLGNYVELSGNIVIENLSFKYNDIYIYKNASLSINKNEKILILGESGKGKTTLAYILKGFYKPENGYVFFDDMCIEDINLKCLRSNIGYLPQEAFILDGTIRENLKCVKEDADDNELWWALEQAQIADYIRENLKNGLDEVVNNNGASLSGGQKQRISIARLFLQNPSIIIFDELFTGLDLKTEYVIWENIKNFSTDKTILFITHKILEREYFDSVVVVNDCKLEKTYNNEIMVNKYS